MAEELKRLGNEAFSKGEYKKAAKIYRDAIKLDPTNAVLFSNRAMCFIKLEDWQRALEDTTKGVQLDPESKTKVKLLWRQGISYGKLGRNGEAEASYKSALLIDPKNITVQQELEILQKLNSNVQPTKIQKHNPSEIISIPILEVDRLPQEFSSGSTTVEEASNPIASIVEVDVTVPKLSYSTPDTSSDFPQHPSLYFLSTLSGLSGDHLMESYHYFYGLDVGYLSKLFSSCGIDSDILEYFIDASIFLSEHHLSEWEAKFSGMWQVLSAAPRFKLSLSMCSYSKLKILLHKIEYSEEIISNDLRAALGEI